jgi:hypothetical protein
LLIELNIDLAEGLIDFGGKVAQQTHKLENQGNIYPKFYNFHDSMKIREKFWLTSRDNQHSLSARCCEQG